jgi:hypothetical protein
MEAILSRIVRLEDALANPKILMLPSRDQRCNSKDFDLHEPQESRFSATVKEKIVELRSSAFRTLPLSYDDNDESQFQVKICGNGQNCGKPQDNSINVFCSDRSKITHANEGLYAQAEYHAQKDRTELTTASKVMPCTVHDPIFHWRVEDQVMLINMEEILYNSASRLVS